MSIQDGNYIVYEEGSDPVYVSLTRGRIVRQVCAGELALHSEARDGRDAIADGIEHAIPTAVAAAIAALLDPASSPECVQVYRLSCRSFVARWGHWPRGRRRHDPGPAWATIRLALDELLSEHATRRRISRRALAVVVGVSPRTVGRWIAGVDVPDQRHATLVLHWVRAEWIRIRDQETQETTA